MTQVSTPQEILEASPGTAALFQRARNPFWMAPMSGITDVCFRQIMDEMGAGVVVSELVSAKGLFFNSEKTRKMIRTHAGSKALMGIQVFGDSAEDIIAVGRVIREENPAFLDINLGCPVKKVVKKGCGAALMRDPLHLEKFLTQIRKGIELPLVVKMRTGWSDEELTIHECVKAATDAGCEWAAIHGRTRAQAYNGRADWDLIAEVKQRARIPIIGNGDIRDAQKAKILLRETGVDAVMIGRGALRNPWIFHECCGAGKSAKDFNQIQLLRRYHELLRAVYDLRRTTLMLRKFAVWMAYGYPGAAAFRGSLFQIPSANDVLERAEEFFDKAAGLPTPKFSDSEAFMMGGHG